MWPYIWRFVGGSLEMGVGLVFFVWDVGAERPMFWVIHHHGKASKYLLLKAISRFFPPSCSFQLTHHYKRITFSVIGDNI